MQFGDVVLRISESVSFPLLSAFLIGILASVSPCPLATNITAMAYISRNITDKRYVVTSGILYTLGRTVSYFTIGALIILAGMKIPHVAETLQDAGEKFLGPLLLIVGIIMLDIVKLPVLQGGGGLSAMGERVAKRGRLGSFLLGIIFALAFCPYSAILFFGIVIPLAIKSTGGVTVPASFAIGTGLPVLLFGILLSAGITQVSRWLNIVTASERVIRKIAALVFIGAGVYYIVLWIQG
jgi:cytochrome c biogenesis protein CcdA